MNIFVMIISLIPRGRIESKGRNIFKVLFVCVCAVLDLHCRFLIPFPALLSRNVNHCTFLFLIHSFLKYLFIYLAVPGLSCGTRDLYCSMQAL